LTEELRTAMQPANVAMKQIIKERDGRATRLKRDKDRTGTAVEEEEAKRVEERKQFGQLVGSIEALNAAGSPSGLYELCGMSLKPSRTYIDR
jgi:ubiquitin carboxyl-terminal hydrolase 14